MNRDYEATLPVAEQAADWLERLPDADAREGEDFLRWLRQSPVHARELFLAVRTAERLKHLDRRRLLNAGSFIALARQNVAQLPTPIPAQVLSPKSARRRRRISSRWTIAAAIGFLTLLMIVTAALRGVSGSSISTAAGESQAFHLADGSVLRAGPRTDVTVVFTIHDRIVRLRRGEIMIYVAKDSSRPLYLETEFVTARAVGTAFAVRRFERDTIVVTVQEGEVAVIRGSHSALLDQQRSRESVILSAGEQVRVTTDLAPLQVRHVDLHKELAWVAGKLVFTTETIENAVHEFNLRNEAQIELLSAEAMHRAIRGTFQATNPRAFALSVARSANLTLVEGRSGTLLLVPNLASPAQTAPAPASL